MKVIFDYRRCYQILVFRDGSLTSKRYVYDGLKSLIAPCVD
jgi:hypothetical protein